MESEIHDFQTSLTFIHLRPVSFLAFTALLTAKQAERQALAVLLNQPATPQLLHNTITPAPTLTELNHSNAPRCHLIIHVNNAYDIY